ncbi:MAG: C40 family peptidase [Ruminiclostridium sp.]|nr:C40 family peptidase [Ruminiclostridium sp.]
MKKYIFAAVFVLLALIIIFTSDYHAEAQTETPQTTTLDSPATVPPPQEMMTTTVPATAPPVIITDSTQTNGIVATAEALMGIEFAEGGDEPSEGFDNSGFIYYVLRENGYIACPRQISGQLEWGSTVGIEEIKAGDVLYFSDEPGGRASFGGIYTGSGTMIYSPYPGEKVKSADITAPYWQSRFVTALSL